MCQGVLGSRGLLDEWKSIAIVPIFKRKSDVKSCKSCRDVKLLKHAMKIVEKVSKEQI